MRTKDCALMCHHHTSEHLKEREGWEADLQKDFHHSGWAPCSSLQEGSLRALRARGQQVTALSSCTLAAVSLEQWDALCPFLLSRGLSPRARTKRDPLFIKSPPRQTSAH